MSVVVTYKIKIGDKVVLNDSVNSFEIDSSWSNNVDSGKMILPMLLKYRKTNESGMTQSIYDNIIKIGDSITIEAGYDHTNYQLFKGWISDIKPKLTTEIFFEDDLWLLKKIALVKSYEQVSLKQLIDYMMGEAKKKYPFLQYKLTESIANLGKFRINNSTILQVLELLRKDYGVQTWVRDGVINIGLAYDPSFSKQNKLQFQKNIITDDLIYRKATDVNFKVRCVSIVKEGKKHKKIEAVAGSPDGEVRTLSYNNITSVSDLQKIANQEVNKMKFDGWYGSLTTFGQPFTQHGYSINLIDNAVPDRNGIYLVKQVKYSMSFGGGLRQEIFLDRKINFTN